MTHAVDIEKQKQTEQLIEEWKQANGITDDDSDKDNVSWSNVFKTMLSSPGLWVFLIVLVISPYGLDIVKILLEFFSK